MSVGDLMAIAVITFPEMGGEAAPDGQAGNEQRQQQSLAELTERQKRLAEARQEAMKLAVAYRSGKRSLAELLDAQRREAQAAFDCIDALVLWMDASELGPSGSQAREHWATVNKLAILERIRDDAFRLWEAVETKHREGSAGSFDEAQAREQHYLLKHAADDMRKRLEESADR